MPLWLGGELEGIAMRWDGDKSHLRQRLATIRREQQADVYLVVVVVGYCMLW